MDELKNEKTYTEVMESLINEFDKVTNLLKKTKEEITADRKSLVIFLISACILVVLQFLFASAIFYGGFTVAHGIFPQIPAFTFVECIVGIAVFNVANTICNKICDSIINVILTTLTKNLD